MIHKIYPSKEIQVFFDAPGSAYVFRNRYEGCSGRSTFSPFQSDCRRNRILSSIVTMYEATKYYIPVRMKNGPKRSGVIIQNPS